MHPSRVEPEWSHDAVEVCVDPGPSRTLAATLPVLVSVGMIAVAMGTSTVAMLVPEMAVNMGLTAGLALGSPVPLWLTARWSAPTRFRAGFSGVRIGRQTIPASAIVSADIRRATDPHQRVVHLLLDDGRILRTPPIRPDVADAVELAFARPSEAFAGQLTACRAARALAGVGPGSAGQQNSPV